MQEADDDAPGTAPRARSTRTQDRIIAALPGGILDRSLPPGSRLPTRRELQQRCDLASATLQRALDRLAAAGFIATRANRGTFVVDHPPRSFHYGLVLPVAHGPVQVHFWTALTNEAHRLSGAPGGRRTTVYAGACFIREVKRICAGRRGREQGGRAPVSCSAPSFRPETP